MALFLLAQFLRLAIARKLSFKLSGTRLVRVAGQLLLTERGKCIQVVGALFHAVSLRRGWGTLTTQIQGVYA